MTIVLIIHNVTRRGDLFSNSSDKYIEQVRLKAHGSCLTELMFKRAYDAQHDTIYTIH